MSSHKQAMIDGVAVYGLRWRFHISLGGQTKAMGKMDYNTPDEEVEACARAIVDRVRVFADRLTDDGLAKVLRAEADQLEESADCGLVEVRASMTSLYDQFDYSRICVVS